MHLLTYFPTISTRSQLIYTTILLSVLGAVAALPSGPGNHYYVYKATFSTLNYACWPCNRAKIKTIFTTRQN